jgi:hypothetical protein
VFFSQKTEVEAANCPSWQYGELAVIPRSSDQQVPADMKTVSRRELPATLHDGNLCARCNMMEKIVELKRSEILCLPMTTMLVHSQKVLA